VGFKQDKLVTRVFVDGKKKDILGRLNRTKREECPDLQAQRQDYDREVAGEKRQQRKVHLSAINVEQWWSLTACACIHCIASQQSQCEMHMQDQVAREQAERELQRQQAEARSYKTVQQHTMETNKDIAAKYSTAEEYEDDFM
jgi:hypothetical protein